MIRFKKVLLMLLGIFFVAVGFAILLNVLFYVLAEVRETSKSNYISDILFFFGGILVFSAITFVGANIFMKGVDKK